jgi:hypothetical protein
VPASICEMVEEIGVGRDGIVGLLDGCICFVQGFRENAGIGIIGQTGDRLQARKLDRITQVGLAT